MVLVRFLITLIFEWPFVFFCFRKEQNRFKKSLQGNLLVNFLSYVLLFSWYWLASGTALYTKMNIVQPSETSFPKEGLVYFISKTDGVCKLDLSSHQIEKVYPLKTDQDDRLFVRASTFDTNSWDILDSSKKILICSNLQVTAVSRWRDTNDPSRLKELGLILTTIKFHNWEQPKRVTGLLELVFGELKDFEEAIKRPEKKFTFHWKRRLLLGLFGARHNFQMTRLFFN